MAFSHCDNYRPSACGIMFHHFHGSGSIVHPSGEGSLGADDLARMIEFLGGRRYILDAKDWIERRERGRLKAREVCFTFDDALLCQFEIAKPVLDSYGIKSFFFVYSSVFYGEISKLEMYRVFRTTFFSCFEDFFKAFWEVALLHKPEINLALDSFPQNYLLAHDFYPREGRIFRYLRDVVLTPSEYEDIMDHLVTQYSSFVQLGEKRWLTNDYLKLLSSEGHVIGLHSYSHPTNMGRLSRSEQYQEYSRNLLHLREILQEDAHIGAAYPCNSYNDDTISIFKDLGVAFAFRSNIHPGFLDNHIYELPREDHFNILKAMEKA